MLYTARSLVMVRNRSAADQIDRSYSLFLTIVNSLNVNELYGKVDDPYQSRVSLKHTSTFLVLSCGGYPVEPFLPGHRNFRATASDLKCVQVVGPSWFRRQQSTFLLVFNEVSRSEGGWSSSLKRMVIVVL